MALQAQQIHVAYLEHVGIRTTVRCVAGRATLNFHGFVLEDEWSLLVGMATKANCILRGGPPHLLGPNRAVRIVAITALHQSLVDAMVKWHLELSLLLRVARITKLRLRFGQ